MAIEIKVPPLGESLVDAVVGQWLKGEGDAINRGETIVELETDKVNLDVAAEDDGVLSSIQKQEGDTVTVGEVLAVLEAGGSAPSGNGASAAVTESPEGGEEGPAADASAQPACLRDCNHHLRRDCPCHGSLDDRQLDPEEVLDTTVQPHGLLLW